MYVLWAFIFVLPTVLLDKEVTWNEKSLSYVTSSYIPSSSVPRTTLNKTFKRSTASTIRDSTTTNFIKSTTKGVVSEGEIEDPIIKLDGTRFTKSNLDLTCKQIKNLTCSSKNKNATGIFWKRNGKRLEGAEYYANYTTQKNHLSVSLNSSMLKDLVTNRSIKIECCLEDSTKQQCSAKMRIRFGISDVPEVIFKGNRIQRLNISDSDSVDDQSNLTCIHTNVSNFHPNMHWKWNDEIFTGSIDRYNDSCKYRTILRWNQSIDLTNFGISTSLECVVDQFRTAVIQIEAHPNNVSSSYADRGESNGSWEKTLHIIYLSIGAICLFSTGVGFGILLSHLRQKRKSSKETSKMPDLGRYSPALNAHKRHSESTKVHEEENKSLQQENDLYEIPIFTPPSMPNASQPSTQDELQYAEIVFKVHTNI